MEFTGKNTMEEVKGKGKRGLFRVIFGRTTFFLLFAFLQILILFWIYLWLDDQYRTYGYGLFSLVSAILAIRILNEKQNASFKMAWLIPVLIFPVFGALFYVFVQLQLETKIMAKRLSDINARTRSYLEQDEGVVKRLEKKSVANANLCRFLYERGGFPAYEKTHFRYFPLGDDFFAELLPELKKAQRFIFLEYFIIQPGIMWDSILEILEQKAKEGVEVRLMYDGMNSFSNLPHDYPRQLEAKGIKCRIFNPIRPAVSTGQNNRDHRKILVIDGKVAFTGGANLADEYINAYEKHGYWQDAALCVQGKAAWSFTMMFLQLWDYWDELDPSSVLSLYPSAQPAFASVPRGIVQPYADSPMDQELTGHSAYLRIIQSAQDYVYIATPYLIIDDILMRALTLAAKSGVDVRIITPCIPDKPPVHQTTRSYYPELIEAGVRIYEFTPGFMHAKVSVSDDVIASVGSVNMDYRSLYLHFECGCLLYDCPCIQDIKADYLDILQKCHLVRLEECKGGFLHRLIQQVLRLFAPLL